MTTPPVEHDPSLPPPESGNNTKKLLIIFGAIASFCLVSCILFAILGAIFGDDSKEAETKKKSVESSKRVTSKKSTTSSSKPASSTTTTVPAISYVMDVRNLVGKDIETIRTILGPPTDSDVEPTSAQMSGTSTWFNSFEKDDVSLLVTFNADTREVEDLFLSYSDDSLIGSKDKNLLLKKGNLSSKDNAIKLKWVETLNSPGTYTGVVVTPK